MTGAKIKFGIVIIGCIVMIANTYHLFGQVKKNSTNKSATAQPTALKIISFEIAASGDTLNRIDEKQHKTGPWLITHSAHYGEEGYMEYGIYQQNQKHGIWKGYTLEGQLLSVENFKMGRRDGEVRYYENGYLVCVGNFLALHAKNKYDTILIEDPVTNILKPKIVETSLGSVKHGFWTYYEPGTKRISKIEEYAIDELVYERSYVSKTDSVYILQKMKSFPHVSNQPVANETIWFLHKGKKPALFTDFGENVQSVEPLKRKK